MIDSFYMNKVFVRSDDGTHCFRCVPAYFRVEGLQCSDVSRSAPSWSLPSRTSTSGRSTRSGRERTGRGRRLSPRRTVCWGCVLSAGLCWCLDCCSFVCICLVHAVRVAVHPKFVRLRLLCCLKLKNTILDHFNSGVLRDSKHSYGNNLFVILNFTEVVLITYFEFLNGC